MRIRGFIGIRGMVVIGKMAAFGLLVHFIASGGQLSASDPAMPRGEVPLEAKLDGLIASPEPDWPQWRGPRRDGISDEKGLLTTWPKDGPRLVWKIGNLGRGWSSPIIVRERLYITGDVDDDLVIYAFGVDGKPRWQAPAARQNITDNPRLMRQIHRSLHIHSIRHIP